MIPDIFDPLHQSTAFGVLEPSRMLRADHRTNPHTTRHPDLNDQWSSLVIDHLPHHTVQFLKWQCRGCSAVVAVHGTAPVHVHRPPPRPPCWTADQ